MRFRDAIKVKKAYLEVAKDALLAGNEIYLKKQKP